MQHINFNSTLAAITHKIHTLEAKSIAIQIPQGYISQAVSFQLLLRKQIPKDCSVYILCDTNKNSCCTDIIGALHVNYDLLVHFGRACFSQDVPHNHMYFFPDSQLKIDYNELLCKIKESQIDGVMVDQALYTEVLGNTQLLGAGVDIMRLPIDKDNRQPFALGYYRAKQATNVLLLGFSEQDQERVLMMKEKLKVKLFSSKTFNELSVNSKMVMRRLYLINKVKQLKVFGILVKNANTKFCKKAIEYCKGLLSSHGKQFYIFMMNNLNQVKLGNFPEIQAYIIISCHNCSLYNESDMHKLVVTPFDLAFALQESSSFGNYDFDLNNLPCLSKQPQQDITNQQPTHDVFTTPESGLVKQGGELSIQHIFQTLDHYKERTFKGIDYSEPKEVKLLTKGKVGLAQEYKQLQ